MIHIGCIAKVNSASMQVFIVLSLV